MMIAQLMYFQAVCTGNMFYDYTSEMMDDVL